MRRRWAVALTSTCVVLALAVAGGFALASTSLADQPGQPVDVAPVVVPSGSGRPPTTAPPTSTPEPTGAVTVPDPPPVEVDDHGGDNGNRGSGSGGDDDSGGDDSGHGSDD